jgi:RNA exonuclease 4
MVGLAPDGVQDCLARVSIVNYFGLVLYDVYIKPTGRVTDWRTKYSGIRPADVLSPEGSQLNAGANAALSFEDVQEKVKEIVQGRILIGHALQNDLTILKLSHPKDKIRDTSLYEPFRGKYSNGRLPSLKKMVQGELNVAIQKGEHDSVGPGGGG